MPPQWSKLLTSSAITKEEAARHPEAVLDALKFYTQQQLTNDVTSAPRFVDGLGSRGNLRDQPSIPNGQRLPEASRHEVGSKSTWALLITRYPPALPSAPLLRAPLRRHQKLLNPSHLLKRSSLSLLLLVSSPQKPPPLSRPLPLSRWSVGLAP
jgi:hypothetical protein